MFGEDFGFREQNGHKELEAPTDPQLDAPTTEEGIIV